MELPNIRRARKRTILAAAALSSVLLQYDFASAGTTASWINTTGGSWTIATNWSTNPVYPNNGSPTSSDEYDVVIGPSNTAYSLVLDQDVAVDQLILNNGGTSFTDTAGTLQAGTIDVEAGFFHLRGGTLRNVLFTGVPAAQLYIDSNYASSTLDNVTLWVDALIQPVGSGSQLPTIIQNSLTLQNTTLTVANGQLSATGTASIGGTGTIVLGTNSVGNSFRMTDSQMTVGSGIIVPHSQRIEWFW